MARSFHISAYDVICEYFESMEVRLHHLKWIGEAMENPEANGTGIMVYNLFALVHASGAYAVKGGTQQLSNKLSQAVEHFGGTVRTNAEVVKVIFSGDRATGVVLADGETISAREGVIACIHPWRLKDVIPEIDDCFPKLRSRSRGRWVPRTIRATSTATPLPISARPSTPA